MPANSSSEVKFEIGHVLFIDIVGYSKLLINEQSQELQKLKEIVRGTEQFRLAEQFLLNTRDKQIVGDKDARLRGAR